MRTQRYTDAQIMQILKQAQGGVPVAELCREHGMSSASFYKWRSKYGGKRQSPQLSKVSRLVHYRIPYRGNESVSFPFA